MKLFFAILLLLFSSCLFSQEANLVKPILNLNSNYTIKTNPFAMFLGPILYTSEYRIAVENNTAQKQSIQLSFSYLGKNAIMKSMEETDSLYKANDITFAVRGFRLQLSYRFYLIDNAPKGIYFAPHISFSTANIMLRQNNQLNTNNYIKLTYINYSGLLGYQLIQNRTIAFDAFIGFGYRDNTITEIDKNSAYPIDDLHPYFLAENFKLYLGFNVGLAF